ncbi:MAG: hypothetical protein WDW38_006830 [Sanguina aurantia]
MRSAMLKPVSVRTPFTALPSRSHTASRSSTVSVQAARFSIHTLVDDISKSLLKPSAPAPAIGDSVKLNVIVNEGKGKDAKTRTQRLEGVIIGESGAGINKTVTFRRLFQGVGIELTVPVHSPVVESMELIRKGRVRRAKLFYLRSRLGKAARLKEVVVIGKGAAKKVAAAAAAAKSA